MGLNLGIFKEQKESNQQKKVEKDYFSFDYMDIDELIELVDREEERYKNA